MTDRKVSEKSQMDTCRIFVRWLEKVDGVDLGERDDPDPLDFVLGHGGSLEEHASSNTLLAPPSDERVIHHHRVII